MSEHAEPVINLHITVPQFALPLSKRRRQLAGDQQHSREQVRIVPLGSDQQHERTGSDMPLTVQKERFHLFQIKDIPAQGRTLLLQVLRRYPVENQQAQGERSEQSEQLRVSDELTLTVEIRRSSDLSTSSEPSQPSQAEHTTSIPPTFVPGLNTVVIFLDENGIPTNYSIDGAKS